MNFFERSAISNEKLASLSGQQSAMRNKNFTGINKPVKLVIKELKSKGRVSFS